MIKEAGDKIKVLMRLLPRMASPADARQLIAQTTFNEIKDKLLIKEALDPFYRPIIGMVNGYYDLDLSEELDQQCFLRLKEIHEETSLKRKRVLGDVSQHGNWSCFRNLLVDGALYNPKNGIDKIPPGSKIKFDFVSMHDVGISSAGISDIRFVNVLAGLGLVEPSSKPQTIAKIAQLDQEGREASHGLGTSNVCGLYAAEMAAKHLHLCYDNLLQRNNIDELHMLLSGIRRTSSPDPTVESIRGFTPRTPRVRTSVFVGTCSGALPFSMMFFLIKYLHVNIGDTLGALEANYTSSSFNVYLRYGAHATSLASYMRAKRTVDALLDTLGGRLMTCAQMCVMLDRLPEGGFFVKNVYSSLKVDMIIPFFGQLVDPINFEMVLRILSPMEVGMLQFRLGWLNIWNPLKPEGYVLLDISRREERQVLRMLILLSVVEPGENWLDTGYRTSWNTEFAPNWHMPPTWFTEQGTLF